MREWLSSPEFLVKGHRLLRLYSYYSLFLALLLLVAASLDQSHSLIGSLNPELMLSCAVLYVFLAASFSAGINLKPDPQLATGYIFFEIILLNVVMLVSGGLNSGLLSIIAIPVVISNLLTPGVLGYGVAAWTSIAVSFCQIYLADDMEAQAILSTGLYGFLCFILAFGTQNLSTHLKSALNLAAEQSARLRGFQRFSQQALLNLPDAIIACDKTHRVLFFNYQAGILFEVKENQPLPDALIEAQKKGSIATSKGNFYLTKISPIDSPQGFYLLKIEDSSRVAQEAQQVKLASLGRLTASIAHEIRNPLSAMRQAAQLLKETDQQGTHDRLTHIIEHNSLRINRIIEDMLMLAKRKETNSKALDMHEFLQNFKQNLAEFGLTIAIKFYCQRELTVFFDESHLQQILQNLCTNAQRYAIKKSGENAEIIIRAKATDLGQVQLDIIDNGGGLSVQQREFLFEPFYTSEPTGTGLGLYVCRELCEANRASIHYLAAPDGACFRLTLRSA